MFPFCPATTVSVAADTNSENVLLSAQVCNGKSLRVWNSGTVTAFLAFGKDNTVVAAAATGYPLPAGAIEVITIPGEGTKYMAGLTSSGTATVYATLGDGV